MKNELEFLAFIKPDEESEDYEHCEYEAWLIDRIEDRIKELKSEASN